MSGTGIGILCLLVAAGLLGPIFSAASKRRLPVIIGEIVAGILLGPHVFHILDPHNPTLKILHDAGFAMLMFDVGLHLPIRDPELRKGIKKGSLAFLLSLPLAIGLGYITGLATHLSGHFLAISVVLATCSAAVALPLLKEAGDITQKASLIAWLLIADITTVVALPLVAHTGSIFKVIFASFIVALLAAAATLSLTLVGKTNAWTSLRKDSKASHWGWDLRIALLIVFGLTWVALTLGASPLVAGFAAGVAMAVGGNTPKRLTQQVVGVGDGFLVPVFFILLGTGLDFAKAISTSGLLLLLLVVFSSVATHTIASKFARLSFGEGLVASAQMGVPAAMVTLGLQQKWLTGGEGASFIAASIVSIGICSFGAHRVFKIKEKVSTLNNNILPIIKDNFENEIKLLEPDNDPEYEIYDQEQREKIKEEEIGLSGVEIDESLGEEAEGVEAAIDLTLYERGINYTRGIIGKYIVKKN